MVVLNGHPELSSFPGRMATFTVYPTSVPLTNASRGKLTCCLALPKFCPSAPDTRISRSWTSAWPTIPSSLTMSQKISVRLTRRMASIVIAFCLLASCKVLTFVKKYVEHILQGIMDADVYIDDIGCFGKSWEQHLQVLEHVMTHLQDNGFSVNSRKCEGAVQETDFLGYWLTLNGLKPWCKRFDAILWLQSKTFTLSSALLPTTALCFRNALTSSLPSLLSPLRSLAMLLGLLNVSMLSTLSR